MLGPWQIAIILLIVVLLFGTKKLRNIGSDLGAGIKGFKEGMRDADEPKKIDEEAAIDSTQNSEQAESATAEKSDQ